MQTVSQYLVPPPSTCGEGLSATCSCKDWKVPIALGQEGGFPGLQSPVKPNQNDLSKTKKSVLEDSFFPESKGLSNIFRTWSHCLHPSGAVYTGSPTMGAKQLPGERERETYLDCGFTYGRQPIDISVSLPSSVSLKSINI